MYSALAHTYLLSLWRLSTASQVSTYYVGLSCPPFSLLLDSDQFLADHNARSTIGKWYTITLSVRPSICDVVHCDDTLHSKCLNK